MIGTARAAFDRARHIPARIRSILVYLAFGVRFKKVGRCSKIFGSAWITAGTGCTIGDFCWIEAVSRYAGVAYRPNLRLGNRVAISDLTHISCVSTITIEDDCLIGSKIYIGDHSHGSVEGAPGLLEIPPALRQLSDIEEIVIGPMTWICDGAVILAGSRIARSSIIAANSVVRLKECRPALIGGVPARVIRYLDGIS